MLMRAFRGAYTLGSALGSLGTVRWVEDRAEREREKSMVQLRVERDPNFTFARIHAEKAGGPYDKPS